MVESFMIKDGSTSFELNACIRILEEEKEECAIPEVKNALNYCIQTINKLGGKKPLNTTTKCPHCKFLSELFNADMTKTDREYWIMTEVFVYLHNGKDYCDYK